MFTDRLRRILIAVVLVLLVLISRFFPQTQDVFVSSKTASGSNTVYEIFVGSFCDSDHDGTGDLNGIRSKLDYIQGLGFDQIWLTPVHPSDTYHKYDVKDYCAIDPSFGTMADYEALLADCHSRGMRVLMDLVLNHTSSAHPWFQQAAAYLRSLPAGAVPDERECRYISYYRFSAEAQDGYAPLADSQWYYEARFWSGMPDLNLDSPLVREEIEEIAAFWLGKGVDGFRLDAVTSYYTNETEHNTEFMRYFCDTCRAIKSDCYIVGEAWTDRNTIASLYESGIDSLFDFPFADTGGVIAGVMSGQRPARDYVREMIASEELFSRANPDYTDAPFYTNHDTGRNADHFQPGQTAALKMAYAMSLLMRGNSFVYYGEEIGMNGSGRDENKRGAMYWSNLADDPDICSPPAGMDYIQLQYPPVSVQMNDPDSILNWFRSVITLRSKYPVIASGRSAEVEGACSE
ncbi:MAG: hypothetical protein IJ120_09585 [Solobacterium sp.]|nr:hypothetical protein [Solobacterium sp.]